jgi:hypothetical protein
MTGRARQRFADRGCERERQLVTGQHARGLRHAPGVDRDRRRRDDDLLELAGMGILRACGGEGDGGRDAAG